MLGKPTRGFYLFEVLACLAIVMLIMGTIGGSIFALRRFLVQSGIRENEKENWARLSTLLRDDIRQAARITTPTDERDTLKFVRSDKSMTEYVNDGQTITRTVVDGGKVKSRRRMKINISLIGIKQSLPSTSELWALTEVPSATEISVNTKPIFLMMEFELRQTGVAKRRLLLGASTRIEPEGLQ
jgi:hypothetical protein